MSTLVWYACRDQRSTQVSFSMTLTFLLLLAYVHAVLCIHVYMCYVVCGRARVLVNADLCLWEWVRGQRSTSGVFLSRFPLARGSALIQRGWLNNELLGLQFLTCQGWGCCCELLTPTSYVGPEDLSSCLRLHSDLLTHGIVRSAPLSFLLALFFCGLFACSAFLRALSKHPFESHRSDSRHQLNKYKSKA